MNNSERRAIMLSLIDELHARHSWCGETHLQKAMYFLQRTTNVPTGYEFILYKHGPFSFELSDEISVMLGDQILKSVPQPYPYGSKLEEGDFAPAIKRKHSDLVAQYHEQLTRVADKLGDKKVVELEHLATALYAIKECPGLSDNDARARQIVEWKPHVGHAEAVNALETVQNWL